MPLRETPRPSNFQEAVDHFKALKTEQNGSYRNAIRQFRNVLDSSDIERIKATYYPDWNNQDIEDLLTELDEPLN